MSTTETRRSRRATRWIRILAVVVTLGLFSSVGVSIGVPARRAVRGFAAWVDGTSVVVDPRPISVAAGLVHDVSVFVGVLSLAAAVWLGLVLLVRVAFGLSVPR